MHIREFRIGDEMSLHAVYYSAIHQLASKDYTSEQINAWAPAIFDRDLWVQRMQDICPFVVENEQKIVAYADIQFNGYIDHFFVAGASARQGIGTMLMNHIHIVAKTQEIAMLTADVSLTAQPFFQKFSFAIVERKLPVIRGVALSNALMRKLLAPYAETKAL
jgi:putative acetyltransferase